MGNESDYIRSRLAQWGEWSARREDSGLGFPRECPYTRMQARSGEGFSAPEVDTDAMDTEQAVGDLPEHLRETVRAYYAKPGTVEQKARDLRCGRDTVYARIEKAIPMLAELLRSRLRKKVRSGG